jgi:GAF domain-containing protein
MLEPLPETVEALAEYVSLEEPDLDESFVRLGTSARTIVPECVGLSLTMLQEGLTFTLVSPTLRVRTLDAAQYLDDGPCERAVGRSEVVPSDTNDLLDEGRWQLFAQTAAAVGVASSLSMPLVREGKVIGGINLYASSPDAFDDHHEALALALGASAEDAVANADLSFSTRLEAAQTPARLRARNDVDTAVGLLAARYHEDVGDARTRLQVAAARSGLSEATIARVLILIHSPA